MKTSVLLMALALGWPVLASIAQDSNPTSTAGDRPPWRHRGPPEADAGEGQRPPFAHCLAGLDLNGDKSLDPQELAQAPDTLAKLDLNGDGQLTADELCPGRPEGFGGRQHRRGAGSAPPSEAVAGERPVRHVPPVVAALDASGDGVIDATELANAGVALLKLDRNSDGQVQFDEIRPGRPQGPAGPGGPPRHRGRRGADTDSQSRPSPGVEQGV